MFQKEEGKGEFSKKHAKKTLVLWRENQIEIFVNNRIQIQFPRHWTKHFLGGFLRKIRLQQVKNPIKVMTKFDEYIHSQIILRQIGTQNATQNTTYDQDLGFGYINPKNSKIFKNMYAEVCRTNNTSYKSIQIIFSLFYFLKMIYQTSTAKSNRK